MDRERPMILGEKEIENTRTTAREREINKK